MSAAGCASGLRQRDREDPPEPVDPRRHHQHEDVDQIQGDEQQPDDTPGVRNGVRPREDQRVDEEHELRDEREEVAPRAGVPVECAREQLGGDGERQQVQQDGDGHDPRGARHERGEHGKRRKGDDAVDAA